MKKIIRTPHDRFTKAALSEKRVARAFFETHLPTEILKQIDLNTLELTQESFVDRELKLVMTDLLFKVKWGERVGYLYLLVEAQSQAERWMPLRVLKYKVEALEHHIKMTGDKLLPAIHCMVLYNGKRPYHEPTDLFELFGEQQALARASLLQPFQLIDLTQISDEEIRDRLWLSILQGCLKHIHDRDVLPFLKQMTRVLHQAEREGGQSLVQAALTYLMTAGDVSNVEEFVTTIEQDLSKEIQGAVMTTVAQHFRQQGMQQGMQQGIQQGIHQGEHAMLLRQLGRKFKDIPEKYKKRIAEADEETLLEWGDKLIDAKSLYDIFGA